MGIFTDFENLQTGEQMLSQTTEKSFGYDECKDLYANWALGKRIVESIIDVSLSTPREIQVTDAPIEVVKQFEKAFKKNKANKAVKQTAIISRVYGVSTILAKSGMVGDNISEPLTSKDRQTYGLRFNVLDPLNCTFSISQDPASYDFLRPKGLRAGGQQVDPTRAEVFFNGNPLFLKFETSALNFAGRSVFANMRSLVESWARLYSALAKIADKASAIFIKGGADIKDPTGAKVAERSALLVKQMRQGQVAFLQGNADVEFFNLNGASEISQMILEVKNALAMALNDTPTTILLDKELNNGLSNGEADLQTVTIKINAFREEVLSPIFDFVDSYIFFKAWNDDFINSIKTKYAELADLSNEQIRQNWINDFSYDWVSIYPQTQKEKEEKTTRTLDNCLKLQQLGVREIDIQDYLNSQEVLPLEVVINKQEFQEELDNTYREEIEYA